MNDVSVNGVWLSTLDIMLVSRDIPPLPETEENTIKLAGRDGVKSFGSTYGARPISLGLFVMGVDYDRTVARLASVFNVRRGPLVIIFDDRPDKRYVAEYRGSMSFDTSTGNRLINVPLKMDNPFPESEEKILETTITHSPEVFFVSSDGDEKSEPVITLTNIGGNIIRSFKLTNEYFLN